MTLELKASSIRASQVKTDPLGLPLGQLIPQTKVDNELGRRTCNDMPENQLETGDILNIE